MKHLLIAILTTTIFASCGKDSKSSPPPNQPPGDIGRNDDDSINGNQSDSDAADYSANDGCGWQFKLEKDQGKVTQFLSVIGGKWINAFDQYNPETQSVSGGYRWTDPESGTDYVAVIGYRFGDNLKGEKLNHLFSKELVSLTGYPYQESRSFGESNLIIGEPLSAHPSYRPVEFNDGQSCSLIMVKTSLEDDQLEIRFGRANWSREEPPIEAYDVDKSAIMTLDRF